MSAKPVVLEFGMGVDRGAQRALLNRGVRIRGQAAVSERGVPHHPGHRRRSPSRLVRAAGDSAARRTGGAHVPRRVGSGRAHRPRARAPTADRGGLARRPVRSRHEPLAVRERSRRARVRSVLDGARRHARRHACARSGRRAREARAGMKLLAFILVSLVALVAVAPAVAAPEGQMTWAVHFSLAPTFFDPAETPGLITPFLVLYALHDGLVKPMPGKPQAESLAQSWSVSADGLIYEFVLRPGGKFHNGDPFTADDVKFSVERYKGAASATLKARIAAVEFVDPHRVP